MVRMEMDCDMDCLRKRQAVGFPKVQVWIENR